MYRQEYGQTGHGKPVLLSVFLFLAGCASPPVEPPPVVPAHPQTSRASVPPAVSPSAPKPVVRETVRRMAEPTAPAARALIEAANTAVRHDRLNEALAKLERAQRISPRSPLVYQALGQAHLAAGRAARAEQFYLKAISLAGADATLRKALWLQVAEARARQGKDKEAMMAQKKAGQ